MGALIYMRLSKVRFKRSYLDVFNFKLQFIIFVK